MADNSFEKQSNVLLLNAASSVDWSFSNLVWMFCIESTLNILHELKNSSKNSSGSSRVKSICPITGTTFPSIATTFFTKIVLIISLSFLRLSSSFGISSI